MDRNGRLLANLCITLGQARKSLWIETPEFLLVPNAYKNGQARKSLWIETSLNINREEFTNGQARKSLWIETFKYY